MRASWRSAPIRSAYLTVYYAQVWERDRWRQSSALRFAHALIFLLAILVGRIVAAFAGLVVGIPSLATARRLSGDRHAWLRGDHSHRDSEYR